MSWDLPVRVKRLTLPGYHYHDIDLTHMHMVVAVVGKDEIVGVAAWFEAEKNQSPQARHALLLHGLYVHPDYHRQGIGQQLFRAFEDEALAMGVDGLLVKAQEKASPFFLRQGMQKLKVENPQQQYHNRYWKWLR